LIRKWLKGVIYEANEEQFIDIKDRMSSLAERYLTWLEETDIFIKDRQEDFEKQKAVLNIMMNELKGIVSMTRATLKGSKNE
jgi:hypothetical protein